jgi:hypothetical protein
MQQRFHILRSATKFRRNSLNADLWIVVELNGLLFSAFRPFELALWFA